ncbi:MAG: DUF4080 domain-containing protein [Clostridia bacterium]|nr:DUF4080 domain-containing protein [Clostridia bacterium]
MYVHTNLAVRCLHAAVERTIPDIQHTVLELHCNQPFATHLHAIWATRPETACFSTYIWNRERVLMLARTLKQVIPELRVVLGGPEVSYYSADIMERCPYIDAIVAGEGEESYPALLAAFREGAQGPLLFEPSAPLPQEEWPDPYDGVPALDADRLWYAETARGCLFHCQYCLSAGEKVRALPARQAAGRLAGMAARGARLIKLVDRTFNFDPARAREIWRELLALDTECVFHFEVEARLLDAESLALLDGAPEGRFQFEIGVQSTAPEVLRAVRRGGCFEDIARAVSALRATNSIPLHLDLIAGLPGESWAGFSRGFDQVYALRPHKLHLGFLKLLQGSGLRRDAEKLGIVYATDPPYEVLSTPNLTFAELQALHDVKKALDWYGNSGRHSALMGVIIGKESAFAVYHELAGWLRAKGLYDAERSASQRSEALEAYAATRSGLAPEIIREAICADRSVQAGYRRYRRREQHVPHGASGHKGQDNKHRA